MTKKDDDVTETNARARSSPPLWNAPKFELAQSRCTSRPGCIRALPYTVCAYYDIFAFYYKHGIPRSVAAGSGFDDDRPPHAFGKTPAFLARHPRVDVLPNLPKRAYPQKRTKATLSSGALQPRQRRYENKQHAAPFSFRGAFSRLPHPSPRVRFIPPTYQEKEGDSQNLIQCLIGAAKSVVAQIYFVANCSPLPAV